MKEVGAAHRHNSRQQGKRYRPATNEGTGNVVGGKADLTIDHVATCPSARPWCPAFASYIDGRAGHVPVSTPPCIAGGGEPTCTRHALPTSRAGLRVVLQGEKESRPALALAFIPGHAAVRTASLPFACGSDRGRSNRAVTRNRVGRGRELGNAIRSAVILSRVGQGWE